MSLLPTRRRITSQMSRIRNRGKNYIKDNNSSRSSNISKDSIGHVQINLNKDEEAALLLELDEMEEDIKKVQISKKSKKRIFSKIINRTINKRLKVILKLRKREKTGK